MVNPNDKRTHPTSRPAAGLSRFRDAKRLTCDKIAACILIEPSLETKFPSSIDKERLDPTLRSFLVLASISLSPQSLAKRVLGALGATYLLQLVGLVDPVDHRANFAFVDQFGWYLDQLQKIIAAEVAADEARKALHDAKHDAHSVIETVSGRF